MPVLTPPPVTTTPNPNDSAAITAAVSTFCTSFYAALLVTGTGLTDGVVDTTAKAATTAAFQTLFANTIGPPIADLQARVAYLESIILGNNLR